MSVPWRRWVAAWGYALCCRLRMWYALHAQFRVVKRPNGVLKKKCLALHNPLYEPGLQDFIILRMVLLTGQTGCCVKENIREYFHLSEWCPTAPFGCSPRPVMLWDPMEQIEVGWYRYRDRVARLVLASCLGELMKPDWWGDFLFRWKLFLAVHNTH